MKFSKLTFSIFLSGVLIVPLISGAEQKKGEAKPADKAAEKGAAKKYPLDTCVVADEKLGSMGAPYVFVHEGQELKLCCKGCLKSFHKDPAKYLKKVEVENKAADKNARKS